MNINFVSGFISECATKGLVSPEQICQEARRYIAKIDEQVKFRIKLSDVLNTFNEQEQSAEVKTRINNEPNKIDKVLAQDVLELLENRQISIQNLGKFLEKFSDDHKKNLIYTTKCMIEDNILSRDDAGIISIGTRYSDFIKTQNVGVQ